MTRTFESTSTKYLSPFAFAHRRHCRGILNHYSSVMHMIFGNGTFDQDWWNEWSRLVERLIKTVGTIDRAMEFTSTLIRHHRYELFTLMGPWEKELANVPNNSQAVLLYVVIVIVRLDGLKPSDSMTMERESVLFYISTANHYRSFQASMSFDYQNWYIAIRIWNLSKMVQDKYLS